MIFDAFLEPHLSALSEGAMPMACASEKVAQCITMLNQEHAALQSEPIAVHNMARLGHAEVFAHEDKVQGDVVFLRTHWGGHNRVGLVEGVQDYVAEMFHLGWYAVCFCFFVEMYIWNVSSFCRVSWPDVRTWYMLVHVHGTPEHKLLKGTLSHEATLHCWGSIGLFLSVRCYKAWELPRTAGIPAIVGLITHQCSGSEQCRQFTNAWPSEHCRRVNSSHQ